MAKSARKKPANFPSVTVAGVVVPNAESTQTTMGRPTKYDPAFAEQAMSFMGKGYSLTAFAGYIGVARETIYDWERKFTDFSDAIKRARAMRVHALETTLLTAETSQQLTASIFSLKNACPQEWREKVEIDHNSTVTHVHSLDETVLADMDMEEVSALSQALGRLVAKGEKPKSVN